MFLMPKKLKLPGAVFLVLLLLHSCGQQELSGGATEDVLERGKELFFSEEYRRALDHWERHHDDDEKNFLIDKWRVRTLLMLDRPEEAQQVLETYRAIVPEHPELTMLLAQSRAQQGRPREAIALLDEASLYLLTYAGIYLTRADLLLEYGLPEQADEAKRNAQILLDMSQSSGEY